MVRYGLLWALAIAPLIASGAIYRWVDAQGVIHYGDHPVPGAKTPDLPKLTEIEAPPPPPEPRPGKQPREQPAAASLTVVSPAPGQTFQDASAPVAMRVHLATPLGPGQALRYLLDGQPVGQPTRDTQALLHSVARGRHQVGAVIVAGGQVVARAPPVTIYMSPPSALSPLTESAPDQQQPAGAPVVPPANRAGGALAAPRFDTGRGPP